MNEVDLIKEVERRPILYDKTVSGFNKTKLRDDAWKEVQEALNVNESECKKRWRSLRDSFIKLQRTHAGRTRWPYLHAMRFLIPHVEPKNDISFMRETSDSEQDEESRKSGESSPESSESHEKEEDKKPPIKKMRHNSTEEEPCTCNKADLDELFLLSCATTLKRLNSKQNAIARLKIQQALYEAEFGCKKRTPSVSPASDNGKEKAKSSVE